MKRYFVDGTFYFGLHCVGIFELVGVNLRLQQTSIGGVSSSKTGDDTTRKTLVQDRQCFTV